MMEYISRQLLLKLTLTIKHYIGGKDQLCYIDESELAELRSLKELTLVDGTVEEVKGVE